MFNGKTALAVIALALCSVNACLAQTVEDSWDEFLHYTVIGRFDLAKGYAQELLAAKPDPEKLLELSKENPQGYQILVRAKETAPDAELVDLCGQVLAIIEQGRFVRRSAPAIIAEEVRRLTSTERGWFIAVKRLRDAGEYAIPFMLDALADSSRQDEMPNIVRAFPQIGRGAIAVVADVAHEAGVGAFIDAASDALGPIDILVANAGGPPPGMPMTTTVMDATR